MENDLKGLASLWDEGPWGWSLATKQRYRKMGVDDKVLPGDEWLGMVRNLSSREWSCAYLHRLLKEVNTDRELAEILLGCEMRFHSEVSAEDNNRIYKTLWSSSGRGVFTSDGLSRTHLAERLQGLLKSQGGYVSDRFYENKQTDCAMEFLIDDNGKVGFLGYSIFKADRNGTYQYNIVDSQKELVKLIGISPTILNKLIEYHKTHLATIGYRGYAGIDMLVTSDGRLHPVVEINFRMNMGILAIMAYERYGSRANVVLSPIDEGKFGCIIENGKLMIIPPKTSQKN